MEHSIRLLQASAARSSHFCLFTRDRFDAADLCAVLANADHFDIDHPHLVKPLRVLLTFREQFVESIEPAFAQLAVLRSVASKLIIFGLCKSGLLKAL